VGCRALRPQARFEANRRQAALRPEMGALTPPRRNLAGYANRRKPFAGADARNGQHNGLCRNISFYPKDYSP